MSSDTIQVDYEQLIDIASKFQQQADDMMQLHQQIQLKADQLKSGGWQGQGANAFKHEMDDTVLPTLSRLAEGLEKAHQTTQAISDTFAAAEEEAANGLQIDADKMSPGGNRQGPNGAHHIEPRPQGPAITQIPPRDYALMSQAAYTDGGELPQELKDKGWERLAVGRTTTGYYGVAYVNRQTGEVVIAHRGTDADLGDVIEGIGRGAAGNSVIDLARMGGFNADGNDLDDDAQIAMGLAPDQYQESRSFVAQVHEQLSKAGMGDYKVTHTGHSLGAVLADLHAAERGQPAITFDNPGAKEPLASIGRTYNPENHVAYQSHENLINTTNQQAGYFVPIRLQTESDQIGIIRDTLHDHSLDNIVDAMNPETGRPLTEGKIGTGKYGKN
ncbi:MAG: WXG100 family type VII secretion target [Ardenticatenaceae bacterium]|nr:WXG100 family type VII secretion target [Anaerolineales bacterium]MCB8920986.1 WXG100 family type VII secretion target [Ardenticatenaceae bacterium]MCB8991590.1 WXG100 family type VII secretion target [Ardenticatenaceae bacterium]MCB9004219.1 WXG100 family type VII secretion target [Ardenticatenaceae bacterium]